MAEIEPFAKPAPVESFSIEVPTDEELSRGRWETLPCGLPVLLAPAGTQESDKVSAKLLRQIDKKARTPDDLRAADRTAWYVGLTSRVMFKGFKDPKTGAGEVIINGETWKDTQPQRERMLRELPTIRLQIEKALENVQEEFGTEVEEAGKN